MLKHRCGCSRQTHIEFSCLSHCTTDVELQGLKRVHVSAGKVDIAVVFEGKVDLEKKSHGLVSDVELLVGNDSSDSNDLVLNQSGGDVVVQLKTGELLIFDIAIDISDLLSTD